MTYVDGFVAAVPQAIREAAALFSGRRTTRRCSLAGLNGPPEKAATPSDLVVQGVEATAGFCLRFRL